MYHRIQVVWSFFTETNEKANECVGVKVCNQIHVQSHESGILQCFPQNHPFISKEQISRGYLFMFTACLELESIDNQLNRIKMLWKACCDIVQPVCFLCFMYWINACAWRSEDHKLAHILFIGSMRREWNIVSWYRLTKKQSPKRRKFTYWCLFSVFQLNLNVVWVKK